MLDRDGSLREENSLRRDYIRQAIVDQKEDEGDCLYSLHQKQAHCIDRVHFDL